MRKARDEMSRYELFGDFIARQSRTITNIIRDHPAFINNTEV